MSTVPVHKQWPRVLAKSMEISATQLYDWSLISSAVEIIGENAKGIMIGRGLMRQTYKRPAAASLDWVWRSGIDEAV